MPIYEYNCLACGEVSEIFQGVGEKDDLLECKYCGSKDLERVLSSTSFSFKASFGKEGDQTCCARGISCDNPKHCCEK